MKRESRKLMYKAIDSLILSIEHFNRPDERGRVCAVLIFLDHAMEMLLKASIIERGGNIGHKDKPGHTIGFDACVGRGLHDGTIQFLTEDQARILRDVNGQRDAAQHYLVDVSEAMLYLHAQSGITVFRDILKTVFSIELAERMPSRVLPVSVIPPTDLHSLFDNEVAQIKNILAPGGRKRLDANSQLRSLIILDKALLGSEVQQPTMRDIRNRSQQLIAGISWQVVFPGVASVQLQTDGTGHKISFYYTKKEVGIPIQVLKDNEVSGETIADRIPLMIKHTNDFDKYSLGLYELAEYVGLTSYQTQAVVWHLKLKEDREYYKEFKRGSIAIKVYAQRAIGKIRETVRDKSIEEICEEYKLSRPKTVRKRMRL